MLGICGTFIAFRIQVGKYHVICGWDLIKINMSHFSRLVFVMVGCSLHFFARLQIVVPMQDTQQESPIRLVCQISVHDWARIIWLKDLTVLVRVIIWRATARAVHLECHSALFLEQISLSRHQIQLSEDFKIYGRSYEFCDVQATLQIFFTLVVVLDRRSTVWQATTEVLGANRHAVRYSKICQTIEACLEGF